MKAETIHKFRIIGKYLAALVVCGVLFVVLFVVFFLWGLFVFGLSGVTSGWFVPLNIIVSIAVSVIVPRLLYRRRFKDTFIFCGIIILIGVIISLINPIVNEYKDYKYELQKRNEIIRIQEKSDFSYIYGDKTNYIVLDEWRIYYVYEDNHTGNFDFNRENDKTENDLEDDAVLKWEGNDRIKGVYVSKDITNYFYILDSDGIIYSYFDFKS
jgi:hypothetical protein